MSSIQDWKYNPEDAQSEFALIPAGKHRVRIFDAQEKVSKSSGDPMVELTLEVSGYSSRVWHYIVFSSSNPSMTNRMLSQLWDNFGIPRENYNLASWRGKVGGANIVIENSEQYGKKNRVKNLCSAEGLPAWQTPGQAQAEAPLNVLKAPDEDVPF